VNLKNILAHPAGVCVHAGLGPLYKHHTAVHIKLKAISKIKKVG